jgi:hypothetical protein
VLFLVPLFAQRLALQEWRRTVTPTVPSAAYPCGGRVCWPTKEGGPTL